jgi:hypothetical protein
VQIWIDGNEGSLLIEVLGWVGLGEILASAPIKQSITPKVNLNGVYDCIGMD